MAQLQTIADANKAIDDSAANVQTSVSDYLNKPSSTPLSVPSTISGGSAIPDATKGLSLNTGSSLTLTDQYAKEGFPNQNDSTSSYDVQQDPFIKSLEMDKSGRLIGSVPKIGSSAQLKTAGSDGANKTDNGMGMTVTGQVSQEVGNTLQALENTAVNDYQNDLAYWQSQGKFWFDPNSEIKPDLDKYLDNMPSAVNALRDSSFNKVFHGRTDTPTDAATTFLAPMINPAAVHNKNQTISTLMNPLNLLDRKAGSGFAGYVSSQAIKGAAGGIGNGAVGAGVGAVVGVVKGIFTWFSAKGEDANNLKQAQQKYELDLQDWTVKRNKRLIAEKEADFKNRQIAEAEYAVVEEGKKDKEEAKKLQRISQGRSMLKNVLMNAGKGGQAYRDRRASAKATRRV